MGEYKPQDDGLNTGTISHLQSSLKSDQITHCVMLRELSEGQVSLHSYLLAGSRLDLTFFPSCSLSELLASSSPSSSSFESSFQVFLSTQKYHKFHLLGLEIALATLSCCCWTIIHQQYRYHLKERSLVGWLNVLTTLSMYKPLLYKTYKQPSLFHTLYMSKSTQTPSVIGGCGYLNNTRCKQLISTEKHQQWTWCSKDLSDFQHSTIIGQYLSNKPVHQVWNKNIEEQKNCSSTKKVEDHGKSRSTNFLILQEMVYWE